MARRSAAIRRREIFARFGPNDPSLFRYRYPASFIGQTIHVKLPASTPSARRWRASPG